MPLPLPIAALVNEAGHTARSVGKSAAVYAALVLVGLTGAGFLLAACFIALAAATDPLIAALIMGGTLTASSAIVAAIMMHRAHERAREQRTHVANAALMASSVSLAASGLKIASRIKNPMFWPAAATLIAGWYLTRSRKD